MLKILYGKSIGMHKTNLKNMDSISCGRGDQIHFQSEHIERWMLRLGVNKRDASS